MKGRSKVDSIIIKLDPNDGWGCYFAVTGALIHIAIVVGIFLSGFAYIVEAVIK